MNPLTEFDRHFHSLQLVQLLLLFVFLIAYLTTIGRVWGARGRLRAAALALFAAIGLCFTIDPWTVGALIVAAAVASVGLFVLATVVLWRTLGEVDAVARTRRGSSTASPPEPAPAPRQVRGATRNTATVG